MKELSVHHIHHVPNCLSCHKAVLVMTRRVHCFYDYICVHMCCVSITLLLQDLSTLRVVDIYIHIYMGFTPCKAEQPLQGMELQEKEAQKD